LSSVVKYFIIAVLTKIEYFYILGIQKSTTISMDVFGGHWLSKVNVKWPSQLMCMCVVCQRFGKATKVAHFIGAVKPWNLSYNRATHSVETPDEGLPHVVDFVHVWWQIFMEDIHYRLIANLASDRPWLMSDSSAEICFLISARQSCLGHFRCVKEVLFLPWFVDLYVCLRPLGKKHIHLDFGVI